MTNKSQWVKLGKLSRNNIRGKDPMAKLHTAIQELYPEIKDVREIGVSPATNKYLEEQLRKSLDKEGLYSEKRIRSAVAMEMLMNSPCDIEEAEDFVLYRRPL